MSQACLHCYNIHVTQGQGQKYKCADLMVSIANRVSINWSKSMVSKRKGHVLT